MEVEVYCRNNLCSLRYYKFECIQLLVGGCHPELQSVLDALHGSCLWAPHHQGLYRVRRLMDGLAAAQWLMLQVVSHSIGGRSQVAVGSPYRARVAL